MDGGKLSNGVEVGPQTERKSIRIDQGDGKNAELSQLRVDFIKEILIDDRNVQKPQREPR